MFDKLPPMDATFLTFDLGGNPTTQYEYQPYPQQIIQNVVAQPLAVQIPQQPQELQMGATYYQPYEMQPYTYQVAELPTQPQPQPQMQLQLQQVQLMPPQQPQPQPQQPQHVTHQAVTPTIISVGALRDLCDPSIIEIDISSASEVYITRTPIKLIITIYRQRGTDKPDMTQKVSINGQPLSDLNFKVNPETESHQNGYQENWEEPKSQTEQDTLNGDSILENLDICESQDMLEVPENFSAVVEPLQLMATENRSTSVESFELEAPENPETYVEPPEICTICVESSETKASENQTTSVESFQLKASENHKINVEPSQPKATETPTTSVEASELQIPKNCTASIESALISKVAENRKTSVEQLTPGFKAFNVINPTTLLEYSAQTTDRKSKQEEVVVIEMEKNAKQISNMEPTKPTKEMEQFRAPRRIVNHQSIEHNLFKLDAIRADGKCDQNNNNNHNNNNNNSTIVEVVRLLSTKSKTHNADQENLRSMRKFPAPEDSAKIPPQASKFAPENTTVKIQQRAEVAPSPTKPSWENVNLSEEKPELQNSKITADENEPNTISLAEKENPEIVVAHASEIIEDVLPDACPIEDSKLAQSAPKQKRGKIDALILDSIPKEPESIQPFGNNQQRNSKKQNHKLSKLERKAIRREVKQSQIGQLQVTEKIEEEKINPEKKGSEGESIDNQSEEKQSAEKENGEKKSESEKKDKDGSGEDSDSSADPQIVCPLLKAVQDPQLRRTLVRIIKKLNCL
ncbi:hypothetical protein ACLKA6_017145 [Drosophila palustris]